tara:strand:- start:956 stop:1429 length:474 start_codon:yes stop_codon:yes gene_type:complete
MLALNIGIIDPGYQGPMSSFLVNFSKNNFLIEAGDVFLRCQFFNLSQVEDSSLGDPISYRTYLQEKKQKVAGRFGDTFLNVEDIVSSAAKGLVFRGLGFVATVALIITFMSFLLNLGFFRVAVDTDSRRDEYISRYEDEIRELEAKVSQLEDRLKDE